MTHRQSRHIFMTTDCIGGVWQYSRDLAEAFATKGDRVTLAVLGPSPNAAQRSDIDRLSGIQLLDTGLPLDWLTRSPAPVQCAAAKIAELAQATHADVFHCNTPILAGAARFSIPVIAVAHGCIATWWQAVRSHTLDAGWYWHRELMRQGLISASRVIAPSAAFAHTVRQTYHLPDLPHTIHNGRRSSQTHGETPKRQINAVVTIGRLWDEAKGVDVLDRAAQRMHLPVLAAGPLRGPSGEDPHFRNLQPIGRMSDEEVSTLLDLRPIFVSTAKFEPFGLAVLEAALAGCALVLSDIPTFRELWEGAAIFVSLDDEHGFAEAVNALADDHATRTRLGEAATLRARQYSPAASAAKMTEIYDAVMPAPPVMA